MHCYRKTGELLNLEENTVDKKECVIGGPLSDGFQTLYRISSKNELTKAVDTYRSLYQSEGINLFRVYDGISDMLSTLKDKGFLLGVATLKHESYARQMLKGAELSQCFDEIKGWDGTEGCTKAVIITKVLCALKTLKSKAMLVGDSVYDAKGADIAGVDFFGVSYGFGISKNDKKYKGYPIAASPKEVSDYLT